MAIDKVSIPSQLTTDEIQTAVILDIASKYNALVDALLAQDTSIPVFGSINTAGLLSPAQKGELTGGSVTALHSHAGGGTPGPEGPEGPEGPQGPAGPAGDDGVVQTLTAVAPVEVDLTDPAAPEIALDSALIADLVELTSGGVTALHSHAGGGGGGTNLEGVTIATDYGVVGDGVTDDYAALNTLVNTTLQPAGGTVYLPRRTYKINSDITFPANIVLWTYGGVLSTEKLIVIRGELRAPLTRVFSLGTTGRVRFKRLAATGHNERDSYTQDVYPEWFGAMGNGTNDDWEAFYDAINSIAGTPNTGLDHIQPCASSTSTTATLAVGGHATNALAGGLVIVRKGLGAGQVRRIVTNTSDTVTLSAAHAPEFPTTWTVNPDTTSLLEVTWPTHSPRIAGGRLLLAPGTVYKSNYMIPCWNIEGLTLQGAGYSAKIQHGGGYSGTVASATTGSVSVSGTPWTTQTDQFGWGYYIVMLTGTLVGKAAKIRGVSGNNTVLFTAGALGGTPDPGDTFQIAPQALLDLTGFFGGSIRQFTLHGGSDRGVYSAMMYHRFDPITLRGSSKFTAEGVWIYGKVRHGFHVGHDESNQDQEDLTSFVSCFANGGAGPPIHGQVSPPTPWYNSGWKFGAGQFSNNLNHSCVNCTVVHFKTNVALDRTNVMWLGGTVQSAQDQEFYIDGGLQCYLKVSGTRTEGTNRLLRFDNNPYQVPFYAEFENMELQINALVANEFGYPDVVLFNGDGLLVMRNMRFLNNGNAALGEYATGGTTTTLVQSGASWTTDEYAGYSCWFKWGAGAGQRVRVISNTADTLTFESAVTTAPDSTTEFDLVLEPTVNLGKTGILHAYGLGVEYGRIESFVRLGTSGSRAYLWDFRELDRSTIVQARWPEVILTLPTGINPGGRREGVAGQVPKSLFTQLDNNTFHLSHVHAPSVVVKGLGTSPTPSLQTNYVHSVSGTASGGTTTTLVDAGEDWRLNEWVGDQVSITGGTGSGQSGVITANTADTLTIGTPWAVAPDGTSVYTIAGITTHIYKLVAKDSSGKRALASASASITTRRARLGPQEPYVGGTVRVFVSRTAGGTFTAAAAYDILKDDGTGTFKLLAADVPHERMNFFEDIGQTLTAYTLPVTDETGVLQVDNELRLGMSSAASGPVGTVVGKYPVRDAAGTLLGVIPIYDAIT